MLYFEVPGEVGGSGRFIGQLTGRLRPNPTELELGWVGAHPVPQLAQCPHSTGRVISNPLGNVSHHCGHHCPVTVRAGPLPTSWSALTSLTSLDLSHNQLTGAIMHGPLGCRVPMPHWRKVHVGVVGGGGDWGGRVVWDTTYGSQSVASGCWQACTPPTPTPAQDRSVAVTATALSAPSTWKPGSVSDHVVFDPLRLVRLCCVPVCGMTGLAPSTFNVAALPPHCYVQDHCPHRGQR